MSLDPTDLLWAQNLFILQDNKDNFLYENVKTAFSPLLASRFRARFKNIFFTATTSPNPPYIPIAGNPLGGTNSVAPTKITTLDSTEKGLLIHTSQDGLGSTNQYLWEPTDIANYFTASTFAEALGDARYGDLSLCHLLAEDTFKGTSINMGRMSRNPSRPAKVTLVWTGIAGSSDQDVNLDLYLQGTNSGIVYTPNNVTSFGGFSFVGTDSTIGGAGVDLNSDTGAIEHIKQIYLPAYFSLSDTSFNIRVDGSLGSAPVTKEQDFSIFFTAQPVCGQGHGWGDVHLYTFDGKPYDFQSFGEFLLVNSLADEFQVQTRQKPWFPGAQVSVNKAFAIRLEGKTFVYDSELPADEELSIDGRTYHLTSGVDVLLGNTIIQRSGNRYTFTYAGPDGIFSTTDDNDVIIASDIGSYINIFVNPSDDRAGLLQGLLGNGDGDSTNDFALRDGTDLGPNPSVQTIHRTYADSWRISKENTLFYVADPAPAPEPFPEELISLETLTIQNADAVAAAFAKAREIGIPEGAFLNGAVFDFLVTGDETFLFGAKDTANLALLNEDVKFSLGSIQGGKWNDLNENSVWEEGESGLAGWTVYLDSNTNWKLDPWEISSVTDAKGNYSFTNLGPGEYAVREVMKAGWKETFPNAPHAVILNAGENLTNINFGSIQLPTINMKPTTQTIVEGLTPAQNASYTVTLSNVSREVIVVDYTTANGTAMAGLDYIATTGTLIFNPGVTSQVLNVAILNDSLNEADETFAVTLSSPTNAVLGTQTTGIVTITDTLTSSITATLPANVENLTLTGLASIPTNGTGNTGNNVIRGNGANNMINGGAGLDTLTGAAGSDVFLFRFMQSSVTNPDRITDFAISSDKIDLLSATGSALPAPTTFSRAVDSAATNLTNAITAVFADANGGLAGNQTLGINSAALVRVTAGAMAGTYLIVNDHLSGFQSANDLVVNLTGHTGPLPALGNIPSSSFFV